jgi:hypothetical protein
MEHVSHVTENLPLLHWCSKLEGLTLNYIQINYLLCVLYPRLGRKIEPD